MVFTFFIGTIYLKYQLKIYKIPIKAAGIMIFSLQSGTSSIYTMPSQLYCARFGGVADMNACWIFINDLITSIFLCFVWMNHQSN